MIGLLQRVSFAKVEVEGNTVAEIGRGLLVLVCAERGDDEARAERLLDRLLHYRVFADEAGKMNRSLLDTGGGLLLVPQFTLAADTRSGTRAGFSHAAPPELGRYLYTHLVASAHQAHAPVASGVFGASMQVSSTNDGPVTFWLHAHPAAVRGEP